MAPRPSPTRDTAVRLELSADHVGGQRLEGIARLTLLNRLELPSRERGILLCDGRRLPRCSARAHDLDDLPSLFRHQLMTVTENRLQPARGRAVLDREHQWKSCKTVSDVVSDRLSDLAFRSGVIEHVIRNLKGQPEPVAVDPQSLTLLCSQSTQQGADVAASLKQGCGLGSNATHVLGDIGAVAMPNRLLAHFPGANLHHCPGQDADNLGRIRFPPASKRSAMGPATSGGSVSISFLSSASRVARSSATGPNSSIAFSVKRL